MTEAKLRYTVRKRGNLFWQPTPEMRALGFEPKPLGPDGPESQATALKLYQSWLAAKAERNIVTKYPAGTFGAYWDRLRGTKAKPSEWWRKKGQRTREDYERAWKHIDAWRPEAGKPTLSRTVITSITTELCEQFYAHLESTTSPRERWRAVKGLKILLNDAVVRLRLGYESPAANLTNPQPAGRSAIWLGAEIAVLAAKANSEGFEGMSLAIRLAWETMFSPVDVRTLRPKQLKRDATGWYFHRSRTKTEKEAFAAVSDELAADVLAYLAGQAREEVDETPIIRQRNGEPYRSKDTFGDDFRDVRAKAFPDDKRQFQDIRRSANVEADAAGADKKTMGELLANGLANNKFLDETYTPPTVAKAREVAQKRLTGRAKLAGEVTRLRSKSGS
jgi:integrase